MEPGLFRKLFIIYLTSLICFSSIAQNNKIDKKIKIEDIIHKRDHFSFTLISQIVPKAKINRIDGTYDLGSSIDRGLEIGVNYHVNLKNDLSIIFGLHGGASSRNYKLHIPKNDFNPPQQYDVDDSPKANRESDFYLSAPVFVEKSWMYSKRKAWNLNAGFNIRFYPDDLGEGISYGIQDANGNYVQVFDLELDVTNDLKPWIDYNVGGGHAWILKNYNIFKLDLLMNFSFKNLTKGTYLITVPGKPDTYGTYKGRLSFLGLSFNYILTGANKTLRKMYERNQR